MLRVHRKGYSPKEECKKIDRCPTCSTLAGKHPIGICAQRKKSILYRADSDISLLDSAFFLPSFRTYSYAMSSGSETTLIHLKIRPTSFDCPLCDALGLAEWT